MNRESLPVAVAGAAGRMGRMVVQALLETPGMRISGALTLPDEPWIGQDLGVVTGRPPLGVRVTANPETAFRDAHVVIDFTTPGALDAFLPAVRATENALVSGTTGLEDAQFAALETLAGEVPVLWAPNMSLGANLLKALARQAAACLGPAFDLEILDIHHRHKRDAPSGTALALAHAASAARGEPDPDVVLRRRGVIGPRGGTGQAGVGVLRGGDVVGEHTVYFFGTGERIELTHRVADRMAFARGAVRAARWLAERTPGLYTMDQVLELDGEPDAH